MVEIRSPTQALQEGSTEQRPRKKPQVMSMQHSPRSLRSGRPIVPSADVDPVQHSQQGQQAPRAPSPPRALLVNTIAQKDLPDSKTSALVQQMRSLVVQAPRERPKFDGRSVGTEWLRSFNRTAAFNGHDEPLKLRAVPFSLTNTAAKNSGPGRNSRSRSAKKSSTP